MSFKVQHNALNIHPTTTATMAAADIVTDPHLVAVLKAAAQARSQCEQILTLIAEQKQDGTAAAQEQKKLLSSLAVVRGLNRRAVLGVRETKQKTAEARSEVDTLHLQLQNLYYEQRHLNGEIAVCEGFEYVEPLRCCLSDQDADFARVVVILISVCH